MYLKKTVKRKFRAGNKIKIFSALFVISLLSISIVSFDSAFAKPDDLPRQARAQIPDNQSDEGPQFVSATGKVQGKDLNVHIWVLVPYGVDKNEFVKQALAKHGAQPIFVSEKFSTIDLYWDQFGDESLDNDFVTQNYNPLNDPSGGGGLVALLSTHSTWTTVGSSTFAFDYGGTTTRCPSLVEECGFQNFDGYNDVAWLPLVESNVLGVTWSGTSTDEADMALNTNFSWATNGDNVDIETVLLHENGHVAGLGHSADFQAVMYPSYHGLLRFLQSNDIDGISSLYPFFDPPTIVIYEDDMESGTNGWTGTGVTGLWHQSTNKVNSPTTSWYYGQEGVFNYDTGDNSGYLTSPVISLDGATSAGLEFYEWSSMENGPNWDRTRVQASSDGSSWTTVFESHETFGSWEKREVNLNSYAGGDVYLRFWFDTIDGQFNNFEGWYVDDVKVLVDSTNSIPNDPPTADDDADTVAEGGAVNIDVANGDTDVDGSIDLTSIAIISDVSNGGTVVNADGTVDYTHDGSSTTSDSFTYTIDDNLGATSNTATVNITITSVNDPPTADDDADTVAEGGAVNIDVANGDTDVDGSIDLTSIAIISDVSNGGTVVNADGTVDYTHDGSSTTSDSFTYTIDDNLGATSNTATVNITITSVNDPPTAVTGIDRDEVKKSLVTLNGNSSFDDDGEIVEYEWIKISGSKISLSNANTSESTFIAPNVGPKGKTFVFQLTVTDNDGATGTDIVTIHVTKN